MKVRTQYDSWVNFDNVFVTAIRQTSEGWEIYADSTDDKRVKMGVYKTHKKAVEVAEEINEIRRNVVSEEEPMGGQFAFMTKESVYRMPSEVKMTLDDEKEMMDAWEENKKK